MIRRVAIFAILVVTILGAFPCGVRCDATDVVITKDTIIGTWLENRKAYGNSHNFYADGEYRQYFSGAWDALDPRYYIKGTWTLEGNMITLELTSLLTLENGKLEYNDGYRFTDGDIAVYDLVPTLIKRFDVSGMRTVKDEFEDEESDPEELTVQFDEQQVWKYHVFPFARTEEESDEQIEKLLDMYEHEEDERAFHDAMPD